jgi:hypothetical protein
MWQVPIIISILIGQSRYNKLPSVIDKVTIFHGKCHSLYIKELLKLLLSGLDIVIISLDDLMFLISPNL